MKTRRLIKCAFALLLFPVLANHPRAVSAQQFSVWPGMPVGVRMYDCMQPVTREAGGIYVLTNSVSGEIMQVALYRNSLNQHVRFDRVRFVSPHLAVDNSEGLAMRIGKIPFVQTYEMTLFDGDNLDAQGNMQVIGTNVFSRVE